MKNSEFTANVMRELRECEEANTGIFAPLTTGKHDHSTLTWMRKYLIDTAKVEAVKKIQSGGGVEVLKDCEAYIRRVEQKLNDNFDMYAVFPKVIESLTDTRGAGQLLFNDEV